MENNNDIYKKALELHAQNKGKISVNSKVRIENSDDLSLAYSPGVAEPCREISDDPEKSYQYTSRGNMIAVVSSGTAVLGLGDIGAEAALPVMEGKAILFKKFAGLDAFPVCLDTRDPDKIVETVKLLAPNFAGINLEDIAAPECFYIEEKLKKETDLAIFHDDQHGTAIVILAGLFNALDLTGQKLTESKIIINGAGASATATVKLLRQAGVKGENIIVCDSTGIIYEGRKEGMNEAKKELAAITNPGKISGELDRAVEKADIFIGLSVGGVLSENMVRDMADDPIIFALANPEPEINPQSAVEAGAEIIATGRSDYPNQINNVLAFPGVLRGAISVRSAEINNEMKLAAARAIANLVKEPTSENIIPAPFQKGIAGEVAISVAEAAMETGVAQKNRSREDLQNEFADITY